MVYTIIYHPDIPKEDLSGIPRNIKDTIRRAIETRLLFNPDFAIGFEKNGLNPDQDKACEQKNRRRIQRNTLRKLLRVKRSHGEELETFYQNPIAKSGLNPFLVGEPLRQSLKGHRKLRVGDYRVIYRVDGGKIIVLKISHRKDVYSKVFSRLNG